jgi:hypothetical protein
MHRTDAFEHLFRKTFVMHVVQGLLALDDAMEITVHELDRERAREKE